ncbi:aliphatic sulfonate ABC transporter substrate-binding protein [Pseudomonas sp. DSP3-2-2]|uniref:aliphatic sulfonate ABC transporter substrate-binding protein n=1 Tax=unclassified Pseudomonas TaxID=196821 RepID=UPI003CE68B81
MKNPIRFPFPGARYLLSACALAIGLQSWALAAESTPAEVHLDYAYYSPVSLVLKHFGWLEQALPQTRVGWVLSQGSNRSLEYLNSGGVDFASSASLAAVLNRANGSPIKSVYVYSRAEWTALVVRKDSPYKTVADLKGKKIAATKGTDPYLFTLRSLQKAGLSKDDVELVHLQHPDGRTALEKGDVDAWAGLDPHMAASQVQAGSRLLYRNTDFNSYGVVSVTEKYAQEHPKTIETVLSAYEKAREWSVKHPDELAQLLATESGLLLVTHDVDEALYLSDRVLVMGNRPSSIREELPVDLPHPRDRRDPLLASLKAAALTQLQHAHVI